MSNSTPSFPKLNSRNYASWRDQMAAWGRKQGWWRIVSGDVTRPDVTSGDAYQRWLEKVDKAAGEIYLAIEDDQKHHLAGVLDDPKRMWELLERGNQSKKPGMRFNTYSDLFSVRKEENETLEGLISRVTEKIRAIKDLRPAGFTLDDLDNELHSMALIRALPDEYSSFISSLMLIDNLDRGTVHEAFRNEQLNRERRLGTQTDGASSTALAAKPSTPAANPACDFCGYRNHTLSQCRKYSAAKVEARKPKHLRGEHTVSNTVSGPAPSPKNVAAAKAAPETEFAGNASPLPSPHTAPLPSTYLWNADTGATSHMTPHRHWLRDYTPLRVPIRLADNTTVYSKGIGNVVFKPVVSGKVMRAVEFTRVLHVPDLQNNLLAVLYLSHERGIDVHISPTDLAMRFSLNGEQLFVAPINLDNSAFLAGETETFTEHAHRSISTLPPDRNLWHRRLGHHSYDVVSKIVRDKLATGMRIDMRTKPQPVCEPCLAGKMNALPFPTSSSRAAKPLDLIHTDLHGPFKVQTHSGYRYWILFIDDHTRFRVKYFLRKKDEAFEAFKLFKAKAENYWSRRIKAMIDDKGGEYMSAAFLTFTSQCGIERLHTVRNRPQQNGVAERANRTIQEHATAMLYEARLPPSFLGEAVDAYVTVQNKCPTNSLAGKTPFELWYKRKPDLSNLRVWGCSAYVHVQKDKRTGIGSHMEKCIFIGYPDGYKAWKFYNPVTRRIVISERAEFDERYFPGLRHTWSQPQANPYSPLVESEYQVPVSLVSDPDDDDIQQDSQGAPQPGSPTMSTPSTALDSPVPSPPQEPESEPTPPPQSPPPPPLPSLLQRRAANPRRNAGVPPKSWWTTWEPDATIPVPELDSATGDTGDNDEPTSAALSTRYTDPQSVKEAMRRTDWRQWQEAMNTEMNNHLENGTWEYVELPPGAKAIDCKWVLHLKHLADGSIERRKGRLVAKGFTQRPGFEYAEDATFSPVYRPASLRLILALAAQKNLHLRSVDISHAFLLGKDLEEVIYMRQPEGFHQGGPNTVCLLRKPLYGLKQSARNWNDKLHEVLTTMKFSRCEADRAVYIYSRGEVRIIVPIFVDDITLAGTSPAANDKIVEELKTHFKLRDLGPTKSLLGIHITHDIPNRTIYLSQRQYIVNILERFGMSECKPVTTPIEPNTPLTLEMSPKTSEEAKEMKKIPYLVAVGSLMYLATTTRPDIAYAVGVLGRFNHNPGLPHWVAVKHLLRYLKGTIDHKLVYGPGKEGNDLFITYTDADHGGNKDNGWSTGGYVTCVGGGAIDWRSWLQPFVTLSTTEAEFVAAVEAGKAIKWTRNILHEFGYPTNGPSTLLIDNQSALTVSKNPEHHGRMKHLDLKFFWLRDQVEANIISPVYIPTSDQIADIFTKALTRVKVEKFRMLLGLRE